MRINPLVLVLDRCIWHVCNLVAKVAALCGEVGVLAQALDSAEQELKLPVSSCGCVLRDLFRQVSSLILLAMGLVLKLTM